MRNSRSPSNGSVRVTGLAWCSTLMAGSTKEVTTKGSAGSSVLMMTVWESAAEYAREPSALKVMSWESVPRPGRTGSGMTPWFTGAVVAMSVISQTSMPALAALVISSELEL